MNEGGKHLLKKILLIDIVIVIYIILTSTIIDYRTEKKVWKIMSDSVVEWSEHQFGSYKNVIEREINLSVAQDKELADRLKGKILLQVEAEGEAWYLNPDDNKRYYLGRPSDTWRIIRELGIALSENELFEYVHFEKIFPESMAGRFILNEDNSKEAYYVELISRKGIKLSSPQEAWQIIKAQGLGVSNLDIRKIEVGLLGK